MSSTPKAGPAEPPSDPIRRAVPLTSPVPGRTGRDFSAAELEERILPNGISHASESHKRGCTCVCVCVCICVKERAAAVVPSKQSAWACHIGLMPSGYSRHFTSKITNCETLLAEDKMPHA